jgi:tetratricopeptide (TPR) repeat protein
MNSASPAMEHYRQAVVLARQKDNLQALAHLKEVIQLEPEMFDAYFLMGRIYLEDGKSDKALSLLKILSRRLPNDPEVSMMLGQAYEAEKQLPKAIQQLEKVVKKHPHHQEALFALVQLHSQAGRMRKAISRLRRYLSIAPKCAEAHYWLGEMYLAMRKSRKAEQAFTDCLKYSPDHRGAQQGISRILNGNAKAPKQKGGQEAKDRVRQLALDAAQLVEDGLLEEAGLSFQSALDLDPGNDEILLQQAILFHRRGMPERSCQILNKLLENDKDNPLIIYNLGASNNFLGKTAEAIDFLQKAIELDPYYGEAYFELGICYQKLRKLESAEQAYNKAMELNTSDPRIYYNYSQVLYQQGREEESERGLADCIKHFPRFPEAYVAMANILRIKGKFDDAVQYSDAALSYAPSNYQAIRCKALIEGDLGHHEQALALWEKVAHANPADSEAIHHCEVIRTQLGLGA